TDRSGRTMLEVVELVKRTDKLMEAFSEASNERLREAQTHTTSGLKSLRTAAEFAAGRAQEMTVATEQMQAETTEVGNNVERLDACSGHIDAVLNELELVKHQLELECPGVNESYDAGEVENCFRRLTRRKWSAKFCAQRSPGSPYQRHNKPSRVIALNCFNSGGVSGDNETLILGGTRASDAKNL